MVSKAKAVRGSAQSIDYIMSDKEMGDALILDSNGLAGENGNEMLSEMRFVQQSNTNCQNNCVSIVLSPSDEKIHDRRTQGINPRPFEKFRLG